MDNIEWCKYFEDIERDPSAITPRLTVRQFYEGKQHVEKCDACFQRTERILAKMPLAKRLQSENN